MGRLLKREGGGGMRELYHSISLEEDKDGRPHLEENPRPKRFRLLTLFAYGVLEILHIHGSRTKDKCPGSHRCHLCGSPYAEPHSNVSIICKNMIPWKTPFLNENKKRDRDREREGYQERDRRY